jgi:hypothetical protein
MRWTGNAAHIEKMINAWPIFVVNGGHSRVLGIGTVSKQRNSANVRTWYKWLRTRYKRSNEAVGHQSRTFLVRSEYLSASEATLSAMELSVSSQWNFICLSTRDRFLHRNLIGVIENIRLEYREKTGIWPETDSMEASNILQPNTRHKRQEMTYFLSLVDEIHGITLI